MNPRESQQIAVEDKLAGHSIAQVVISPRCLYVLGPSRTSPTNLLVVRCRTTFSMKCTVDLNHNCDRLLDQRSDLCSKFDVPDLYIHAQATQLEPQFVHAIRPRF